MQYFFYSEATSKPCAKAINLSANNRKVHDITPESARWGYVGFGLYHLEAWETVAEPTGDTEVILVLVEGKAEIGAGDDNFGELGERMNVFERTSPHCVYVQPDYLILQSATPTFIANPTLTDHSTTLRCKAL